ncbi:MAG: choice-of-anchor B family protein, partial [Actinobacteria bacterium]|nr:choice-of-anchor B family protein [Actinomycetota bacterium]
MVLKRFALGIFVAITGLAFVALAHDPTTMRAPVPSPHKSGAGQIEFQASGIQLLSWIPVTDFDPSFTSGNSCSGYVSPSGREYAIMGLSGGTGFVEVTDPGAPVIVEVGDGPDSLWHDMKVYGDNCYVVSEAGSGIQIFDMSQIDLGVVTHVTDLLTGGCTTATHTLAVDTTSGFLYRCGGSGTPCGGGPQGLVIYSLANPNLPALAGTWSTRYVHEAQVITWDVPGPHFGKQIAFCCTETSSGGGSPALTILDVTNKAAIVQMSQTSYASSAFSHQCWVSPDRTRLYLDDELDDASFSSRTRVFNITNLNAPTVVGTFTSGSTSIDHNLYVVGNRIYESNYRSGLRVFDSTNQNSPTQIAWFDTYPEDDEPEFNSLWNNYPFLPSGHIIGSDIEKGMFVWHVGDPTLVFSFPAGNPEFIAPGGGTVLFEVIEDTPGDLQAGTVAFHYDTGSGFTSAPATPVGGDQFEADLPPIPCGEQVFYYVSAQTTGGVTWTDPPAGPTQVHSATAALLDQTLLSDALEVNSGWTVGATGDNATTGIWTRVNPVGTSAQPEDDHTTNPGVFCFVTGQGAVGGGVGDNDVDSGTTTLVSPAFDLSAASDPYVSYWRWYSNNQGSAPGEDTFVVQISGNNGTNWVTLETVGPTGTDTGGGWIRHRARVADFVTPSSQVKLRFRASDLFSGSIVEAAVDDLEFVDLLCTIDIVSVVPDQGPFEGGNLVTITGEGFVQGFTTVRFGTNPSPAVTVLSPTQLQARVPRGVGPTIGKKGFAPLHVPVTVTTGSGSATLGSGYDYELP